MKAVLASVSFMLMSSISLADSGGLKSISCLVSNGVTIKTLTRTTEAVVVESRLGILTEKFNAALTVDEQGSTYVELTNDKDRVEYLLHLPVDLSGERQQSSFGTVIRTGDGVLAPFVFATTRCKVRLLQ